ncbi:secretory carrier-associated membrane protein 1-like isoform X1 [Oculina patagonica]
MANFDDNPFAGDSENPFADPSVASVTSNAARGLEDFNPFADQNTAQASGAKPKTTPAAPPPAPKQPPPSSQPAVLQTKEEPPPYVIEEEQENLRKRQEDLERKAAELQRKEQELQRMQFGGYRENNFPPLPSKCPCKPCFFHDISIDIPIEYQKTCKALFFRWQVYCIVLFFNFITAMALLIKGSGNVTANDGSTFGLSGLYLFANIPLSFIGWYRPCYRAFKNDSSFSYVIFFLIYFLHIGINIFYCLGIPGGGACGFINATQAVHNSLPVGAMMYTSGALFLAGALVDVFLLIRVHRIYRLAGASFQKAQGEFARGVASNPHVQSAATEAAAAGVRNAMTGDNRK